jgi:hypothetical protein
MMEEGLHASAFLLAAGISPIQGEASHDENQDHGDSLAQIRGSAQRHWPVAGCGGVVLREAC